MAEDFNTNSLEKTGNISVSDQLSGYMYSLKALNKFTAIKTVLKYRRIYKNYFRVALGVLKKAYPIKAILPNGDTLLLHNELEAQVRGGRQDGFDYDINNDLVTLTNPRCFDYKLKVLLYGGISSGDIRAVFLENVYLQLPVKEKTVIDIGANIADSSIYFALRGANRVIGLEPYLKNFQLAKKNIAFNNLSHRVTILLAGCGANNKETVVNSGRKEEPLHYSSGIKAGLKVPLLTLQKIIAQNIIVNDDSVVLKMDCEGCEYEAILSTDTDSLQKFSHILIEYHYGYRNLKEKLEKSGFNVSVTKPRIYSASGFAHLREGYIFAEKY